MDLFCWFFLTSKPCHFQKTLSQHLINSVSKGLMQVLMEAQIHFLRPELSSKKSKFKFYVLKSKKHRRSCFRLIQKELWSCTIKAQILSRAFFETKKKDQFNQNNISPFISKFYEFKLQHLSNFGILIFLKCSIFAASNIKSP